MQGRIVALQIHGRVVQGEFEGEILHGQVVHAQLQRQFLAIDLQGGIFLDVGRRHQVLEGILVGRIEIDQGVVLVLRRGRDQRDVGLAEVGLGQIRHRGVLLRATQGIEPAQAVLGDVENGLGMAPLAGQGLQVVFDRRDGIGQHVEGLVARWLAIGQQFLAHVVTATGEQFRGPLQIEDGQAAADAIQRVGNGLQHFHGGSVAGEVVEGVLDVAELAGGLLDDGLEQLLVLGLAQLAFGLARLAGFGLLAGLAGHAGLLEGVLQRQHGGGHAHQVVLGQGQLALGHLRQHLELILQQAALQPKADHAQGVGHLLETLDQRLEALHLRVLLAHEHVQGVLDPRQILEQHRGDGAQQFGVGAGQIGAGVLQGTGIGQDLVEPEGFLHFPGAIVRRLGGGHVVEQVLEQFVGRLAGQGHVAVVDDALDLAIELAEQQLHRHRAVEPAVAQALHQAAGHPQQAVDLLLASRLAQLFDDLADALEAAAAVLVPEPAEQAQVIVMAQLLRQRLQIAGQIRRRRRLHGQIRREQGVLRQQGLAAGRAQIVEQRQQHHGHVVMPGEQVFEIVRQLQDATDQHLVGVLAVADLVLQQGLDHGLHFLGGHGRAVEFHHLQGAAHLVQVVEAELQARFVLRLLHIGLEGRTRLLEGLVDFGLHPGEGVDVQFVARFHDSLRGADRRNTRVPG